MTRRTSRYLVPLVLGTMAVCLVFLNGCKPKEEPAKPVVKADPPSVYMKDKDFRAKLDQQRAARTEVLGVREKLMSEMERRVDAMRAKLEKAGREGTPGTEGKAGREGTPGTVGKAGREGTPGTVSDEDVKKELEKDPEWNSLVKKIEDANAAFEDNRKATTKIVGERLAARPQKPLK